MRKNNKEFQHKKNVILFLYRYGCHGCGLISNSNHVHHLNKNGNDHNAFNLVPLCKSCHKLIHKNYYLCMVPPDAHLEQQLTLLNTLY